MGMVQIGVKIEESIKNRIREVVSTGKYRDMSDFAAKAIIEKLNRENEETVTIDSLQSQINELKATMDERLNEKIEQYIAADDILKELAIRLQKREK